MNFYAENAMKQIHENFHKKHEEIKREILQLLEQAFQENERHIRAELANQGKIYPPEFSTVERKIESVSEEINHLLRSLKGIFNNIHRIILQESYR